MGQCMKTGKRIQAVLVILALVQIFAAVCGKTGFFGRNGGEKNEPARETAGEASYDPGQLYAQSAVLMDADSGRVLYGKEEEKIRPMASTTKIMTCILALENMEESQVAEVSERAARQPKVRLGVKNKEKYYIKDLLYALMLESYNDSAVAIAEAIGGSVPGFAEMMNEKAKGLGCEDTHFVTPNGLDGEDEGGVHATTAADLARIMRYCITESPKKEEFLEITRTKSYSFSDADKRRNFSCNNHNAFLGMMEGALTGKTGFTADAGYCYVGALRRDERTFIVALLACGWPNNKSYKWKDTRKLMEYALENYEYRNVWQELPEQEVSVKGGVDPDNGYLLDCRVSAGLKKGEVSELKVLLRKDEAVTAEKKIEKSLNAPVKKGKTVGEFFYMLNGEKIADYDIVTLEDIEKRDAEWCVDKILRRICL